MRQTAILIALSVVLSMVISGCSGALTIPTKAMPPGANYTGLWYSNYDDMRLVQEGDKVQGTFEYKDGGRINGTLEGGVLVFEWLQKGDLNIGRREVTGKGYWVISDDGASFKGKWGYGDSYTDGGVWTAEKAQQDYTE